MPTPAGVEVCVRRQGDTPLHFVINHNEEACAVEFDAAYVDLLTDEPLGGTTLAPHQVLILRREGDAS
jgi:beta-galactosidase GanA